MVSLVSRILIQQQEFIHQQSLNDVNFKVWIPMIQFLQLKQTFKHEYMYFWNSFSIVSKSWEAVSYSLNNNGHSLASGKIIAKAIIVNEGYDALFTQIGFASYEI